MTLANIIDKANQTLFRLVFPKIPVTNSITDNKQFILNIHTINIPGITISSQEMRWQGGKIMIPDGVIDFPEWTISFIVDETYSNWKVLHNWITYLNNNKDKFVEDYTNYSSDAMLLCKNNWMKDDVLKLNFIRVWPTSLGEISLTTRTDGSELIECDVTFAYDRYEIVE